MGPPKLAATLQIPIEESEALFKEYAQSFPKLEKWLNSQAKFGLTNGFIRLNAPHNGIRWFPDIKKAKQLRKEENPNWRDIMIIEGKAQRDSMNTGIQGIGAVICKEALVICRNLLKSYDGYMLPPIHDELNFEIKDEQADEFTAKACQLMKEVGNKYVTKVQMEVEATKTKYWTK
jgi:DNA polymerase-1